MNNLKKKKKREKEHVYSVLGVTASAFRGG